MKRLFLIIAITALTLSCYRREDFHECDTADLNNRVTELEGSKIPSIEGQIASINASISDLEAVSEALKEQIAKLEKSDAATAAEIEALKQKDADLELLISNLTNYVRYLNESTIDWANATFATIQQFNSLSKELASLKSLLESYKNSANSNLSNAISNLTISMKRWVNEQLANYYTIAEVDAKLEAIEKQIDSTTNAALAEEIENLKTSLQAMKSELTNAYKDAIEKAIEDNNGEIDQKIANAIININSRIDTEVNLINTEISVLAQRLGIVEGKIATIEEQITNINKSIADLQALSQQLKSAIAALEQNGGGTTDLSALKAKDAELEQMISTLRQYVNTELAGMEDWATATFSTIQQYEDLLKELATIKQLINNHNIDVDNRISQAISQSENSMRSWVNAQLTNYYTIAEVEAKLDALQSQINASSGTALAQEVEELKKALAAMKSEVTNAYNDAISTAISDNNGIIDQKIAAALAAANANANDQISVLSSRIDTIEKRLSIVEGKVASIEDQIANINTSIADLEKTDKELKDYIDQLQVISQGLQSEIDAANTKIDAIENTLRDEMTQANADVLAQLNALKVKLANEIAQINDVIAILKAKDADLQDQINNLKSYVNTELSNTQDWASATFATLDKFNQLANEVATIKSQIEGVNNSIIDLESRLNDKIAKDIAAAATNLNAEMQQKINEVTDAYTDAIANAKKDITAAYTAAIADAILTLEDSMTDWVNQQLSNYYTIAEVNAKLAALEAELNDKIDSQKAYLEALISNLSAEVKKSIQDNATLINQLSDEFDNYISANDQTITNLITTINSLSVKVAANTEGIADNADSISNLSAEISVIKADIAAYKVEMADKISDLEALINSGSSGATTQQLEALRSDYNSKITALQAELTNATTRLENLINANKANVAKNTQAIAEINQALTDLKSYVDGKVAQLASDIAKNAANIATQGAMIADNTTAINNNAQAIAKNVADILKLQQDMSQMQSDITAAYKDAISKAITELEGKFNDALATSVANLNTRIDTEVATIAAAITALDARVDTLEQEVNDIKTQMANMLQDIADMKQQISDLMKKIQSVSYIHKYSDGKATIIMNIGIDEGIVEFDFQVSPKDAVKDIAANWQSVLAVKSVYTITRAVTFVDMPILAFSADESNGVISVTASGENLSDAFFAGTQTASASLQISDGNNSVTSDYIEMVALKRFKIEYTATAILNPYNEAALGANIIENHFDENTGKGYLILDDAISVIGEKAFYNCNELVTITLPNYITTIGVSAFEGCDSLKSITLPNSVTTIESAAFYDCGKLATVTMGDNVKVIKANAFDNCPSLSKIYCKRITPAIADYTMFLNNASGRKIYVPADSLLDYRTAEGWKYYASDIVGYDFATGQEVASGPTNVEIYYTSTNGKTITVNSGADFGANLVSNSYNGTVGVLQFDGEVTQIGNNAFQGQSISSITIPASVVSIGKGAFYQSSLSSVNFSNDSKLSHIGQNAFGALHYLESITLPPSLQNFESPVLGLCSKLKNIYSQGQVYKSYLVCDSNNGTIESHVLCKTEGGSTSIVAYPANSDIETINLFLNSNTKILWAAFSTIKNLKRVNVVGLTEIEMYNFIYCDNLQYINLNETTKLGENVLSDCKSLSSLTLPMAEEIGVGSFCSNASLTEINMGCEKLATINTIGNNNVALNTLHIPAGVKSITDSFNSCTVLENIYCRATTPPALVNSFDSIPTTAKIYVPYSSYVEYISADGWKDYALHIVGYDFATGEESDGAPANYKIIYTSTDGNVVTPYKTEGFGANIVSNTYKNGQGVITFDGEVSAIAYEAFKFCSTIQTVIIPNSVRKIDGDAFYKCTNLANVYCLATTPPDCRYGAFGENASNRVIYVPEDSVDEYKSAAEYWNYYYDSIAGYNFTK